MQNCELTPFWVLAKQVILFWIVFFYLIYKKFQTTYIQIYILYQPIRL